MITNSLDSVMDSHTVEEFIKAGRTLDQSDQYINFCYCEIMEGVRYVVHNIMDDYISDLRNIAVQVKLSSKERELYKYNPKKLCYKLYNNTRCYWLILKLNDISNIHQFDLRFNKLLVLKPKDMLEALTYICNSERNAINLYKSKHDNIERPIVISKIK